MSVESRRASTAGVLYACLLRDVRIAKTYRLAFVLRFLGTAFQVVVFYFISRLIGQSSNPTLAPYGDNYFAYALIGVAFLRLFNLSLGGYASVLTEAQDTGTLEAQAVLPVSLPLLVTGATLWPYLYAFGETTIYLLMGLILGAPLAGANLFGAILTTILACIAISGLGFMGAAIILLYKRGNAVAWVFEASAALLAGTYFPPQLLPAPLQKLALLLPQTYALAALRAALLQGATTREILPALGILIGFSLVLLPLGVLALRLTYRQAQKRGNLAQY